jgi:hypothetical protein
MLTEAEITNMKERGSPLERRAAEKIERLRRALKEAEGFILANPQLYPHADTSPTIAEIRDALEFTK